SSKLLARTLLASGQALRNAAISWDWASGRVPSQETNPVTAIVCRCQSRRQIPYPQGDRLRWFLLARPSSPCSRNCRARDCGSSRHTEGFFGRGSRLPLPRRSLEAGPEWGERRSPQCGAVQSSRELPSLAVLFEPASIHTLLASACWAPKQRPG